MMKPSIVVMVAALTGCGATPVAKQYYAACIEAGYSAAECKMRAIEVNQRALAGAQASFQQAGQSFRELGAKSQTPASVSCTTIDHGGPVTITNCDEN